MSGPTRVSISLLLVVLLGAPTLCDAKQPRSSPAKAEFKRTHPCPGNGAPTGPCPGYVIDHVVPLACGGADAPSNMQWQTQAEAKAKDKWEISVYCPERKRGAPLPAEPRGE